MPTAKDELIAFNQRYSQFSLAATALNTVLLVLILLFK
jgi:hypothetical protein